MYQHWMIWSKPVYKGQVWQPLTCVVFVKKCVTIEGMWIGCVSCSWLAWLCSETNSTASVWSQLPAVKTTRDIVCTFYQLYYKSIIVKYESATNKKQHLVSNLFFSPNQISLLFENLNFHFIKTANIPVYGNIAMYITYSDVCLKIDTLRCF